MVRVANAGGWHALARVPQHSDSKYKGDGLCYAYNGQARVPSRAKCSDQRLGSPVGPWHDLSAKWPRTIPSRRVRRSENSRGSRIFKYPLDSSRGVSIALRAWDIQ